MCFRAPLFVVLAFCFLWTNSHLNSVVKAAIAEQNSYYTPFRYTAPLGSVALPTELSIAAVGLTIATVYQDCDYGSIWHIPASSIPVGFRVFSDLHICAVHIETEVGVQQARPAREFVLMMRNALFLHKGSNPTQSIRVGWVFWTDIERRTPAITDDPTVTVHCAPVNSPLLIRSQASGKCTQWFYDPDVLHSSSLIEPTTPHLVKLIDYMRRADGRPATIDPSTGKPAFMTWIGQQGMSNKFDTGAPITSTFFAPGHPKGNFPTAMQEDTKWVSVQDSSKYSYCCQTTGRSRYERWLSGRVSLYPWTEESIRAKALADSATTSEDSNAKPVSLQIAELPHAMEVNLTMEYDAQDFRPFAQPNVPLLLLSRERVLGATVAISAANCRTSPVQIYLVNTPTESKNSGTGTTIYSPVPGIEVTFDTLLCTVFFNCTNEGSQNTEALNRALKQLKLFAVSEAGRPAPHQTKPGVQLVWQYWIEDQRFRYITNVLDSVSTFPAGSVRHPTSTLKAAKSLVHSYYCEDREVSNREASEICADWGRTSGTHSNRSQQSDGEGYLVTMQSQSEQIFVADIKYRSSPSKDAWIGSTSFWKNKWANGDILSYYSNWAIGEPQLQNTPSIMNAVDGKWRSAFNSEWVNFTYCCERTAVPDRRPGESGLMNVAFVGSLPPYSSVYSQRTYSHAKPFRPFKYLSAEANISSLTVGMKVAGVTVTLNPMFCFGQSVAGRPRSKNLAAQQSNVTLDFLQDSSLLPPRFFLCPSPVPLSPSRDQKCTTEIAQLTSELCAVHILRDDEETPNGVEWIPAMAALVVRHNMRLLPGDDDFTLSWFMWEANYSFPVLNAQTHHQYRCSSITSDVAGRRDKATWEMAAEYCRMWGSDGYLATITSNLEAQLIATSRRIGSNFVSVVEKDRRPMWIGHTGRQSTWLNGEDITLFQQWSRDGQNSILGGRQPDNSGPTVITGTASKTDFYGDWKNTPKQMYGVRVEYGYCCERNGARGSFAGYSGVMSMTGRTESGTVSVSLSGTASASEETESMRLTTINLVPTRTPSDSESDHDFTATPRKTKTLPKTMTKNRHSPSETESFAPSTSESISITPPKPIPIQVSLANNGEIDADAIRGDIAEKNLARLRTVYVKIEGNWWRAGLPGSTLRKYVKMTHRVQTFYGFSAYRDRLISDASFSANTTHLMIEFNKIQQYDTTNDEVIFLKIDRGATFMLETEEPKLFPTFEIVVRHGDEPDAITDLAITLANALAALGSPSAFKDQQSMAIIGAMKCARGAQRVVFRATGRIISPLRFGTELWANWVGVFVPSFGFVWLHLAAAVIYAGSLGMDKLIPRRVGRRLARIHFPSISVFVAQLLHLGVVFYSVELMKIAPDTVSEYRTGFYILAAWGCLYGAVLMGLIAFWSFKDRTLEFYQYTESDFTNVPKAVRFIVPFGRWGPEKPLKMVRWIIGDFHRKRYVWFEYFIGWFVALIAAFMPDTFSMCVVQYAIMAGFFFIVGIILLILRPFRSHWANGSAAVCQVLLASTMVCAGTLIENPFGGGAVAADVIRWIMTVLVALRGIIGVSVLYAEHKLVESYMAEVQKEKKRKRRTQKIQNILNDDQNLDTVFSEKIAVADKPNYSSGDESDFKAAARPGSGVSNNDLMSAPLFSPNKSFHTDTLGLITPPRNMSQENPIIRALSASPPNRLSMLMQTPLVPVGSTIFQSHQHNEQERRQRLQVLLRDSLPPSAGQLPRGGNRQLPSWL